MLAPLEIVEEIPIKTKTSGLAGLLENDSKSKPSISESSISCIESDPETRTRKDKEKPTQKPISLMPKNSESSKSLNSRIIRFKSEKNLTVNTQFPKKKPSL